MAGLASVMRRTFIAMGILATISLLAALLVLMLLVDSPGVARWFLTSALLAAASFIGAALTGLWSD